MDVTNKTRYQPRFDLGADLVDGETEIGTLAALIDELNYEANHTLSGAVAKGASSRGDVVSARSLHRTLDFIRDVTGQVRPGTRDELPLDTLKVIKFLYNADRSNARHLFNLLAPVHLGEPTMEFGTTTTIARDKSGAELIRSVSDRLAREIKPARTELFDALFPDAEYLNQYIEEANDEIYALLNRRLGDDPSGLTRVYQALAKDMEGMRCERIDETVRPLSEMIYCHVRGLGFAHFVTHHRTFMEEIQIREPIRPINAAIEKLCRVLGEERNAPVGPADRFISVTDFPRLVDTYCDDFRNLVREATGLATRRSVMGENVPSAKRILASYVFRTYDESDPNAPALSLVDIVAALCSVRYQQEAGTVYKPYWAAQKDQGSNPRRHFDKDIDPEDPFVHQGVLMIYLYRFYEFMHAFTGTTENRRAWMAYQMARMETYVRILGLLDIGAIVGGALQFETICREAASTIEPERSAA